MLRNLVSKLRSANRVRNYWCINNNICADVCAPCDILTKYYKLYFYVTWNILHTNRIVIYLMQRKCDHKINGVINKLTTCIVSKVIFHGNSVIIIYQVLSTEIRTFLCQ